MTKRRKSHKESTHPIHNEHAHDEPTNLETSRNLQEEISNELLVLQSIYPADLCQIFVVRKKRIKNTSDDEEDHDSDKNDKLEEVEENFNIERQTIGRKILRIKVRIFRQTVDTEEYISASPIHDDDDYHYNNDEMDERSVNGQVVLCVTLVHMYPLQSPTVSLEKIIKLDKSQREELQSQLLKTVKENIGKVVIYDLILCCQEYLDSHLYRPVRAKSAFEKMMEEKQKKEKEVASKKEEEQRMLKEMKKKHNEALQKEVFEMKKPKI